MRQAARPKYQTYEVVCVSCHEKRWPYVIDRPTAYVCQRCRDTPQATRDKQREHGRRLAAWNRRKSKPSASA